MDIMQKLKDLDTKLEEEELENGTLSMEGYSQLFAYYLCNDDLCSAKFLWKRIPQNYKVDKELERLHKMYIAMWNCVSDVVLKLITSWEWSTKLQTIIAELEEKTKKQTLNVIGNAYTSIFENNLCQMTWLSGTELEEQCKKLNWTTEKKNNSILIYPKKAPIETAPLATSENQLFTLTEFVSFLEN